MNFRVVILSTLMCFTVFSWSQSGYLGKRIGLELGLGGSPSRQFSNSVKDDLFVSRMRLLNMSYRASLNFVVSRKLEMALSYDYMRVRGFSDEVDYVDRDTIFSPYLQVVEYRMRILDDPRFTYNGLTYTFRYFRLGSLAPIGKYIGFRCSFGFSTLEQGTEFMAGKLGSNEKLGFLVNKAQIGDIDSFSVGKTAKVRTFSLRAVIGRNYPLTDNLILKVGMDFPLITRFHSGTSNDSFGFQVKKVNFSESETSSWQKYVMHSIRGYNRVTLEAGIILLL